MEGRDDRSHISEVGVKISHILIFMCPICSLFFGIPFYALPITLHKINCVKFIRCHAEKCSVALLCN
jgi:hypothetical protein